MTEAVDVLYAEKWWATYPPVTAWIARYQESEGASYRAPIVAALRALPPWTSLFEVGCHCGPMLRVVQQAFPEATISGCDVNAGALEAGRRLSPDVVTRLGAFPAVTADMPDGSVDVMLSCYVLAFVSPDMIDAALCEMARVARVGIVLCEPMAWNPYQVEMIRQDRFVQYRHAYLDLMAASSSYHGRVARCETMDCGPTNLLNGLIAVEKISA